VSAVRLITVAAGSLGGGADAGGNMVARALLAEGVSLASRAIVDEDEGALAPALRAALEGRSLVIVLAPPGGSAGEIVRRALARVTGARLVLNDRLLALIEADFAGRGQAMPRRLDRLALLPQGAELWPLPSGEPGWMLQTGDSTVAVLPLGSAHLGSLVEDRLRPLARERLDRGEARVARTLLTAGLPPADAEERLGAWLGREGPVSVSCLLVDGDVWARLLARGPSRQAAEAALGPVEQAVREALGDDCYGCDDDSLEAAVGRGLLERGLTLAVAESCTGGLLGHRLTNVPGSSRYFERGVIVYSNRAKEELLGVPAALLAAHGAVSAQVAEAMAAGIRRLAHAHCGLAVTGIAGPEGGTPAKPVGTVFAAAAVSTGGAPAGEVQVEVRRFRFPGGREAVKWRAAQAALDMLRRALLRVPAPPR
jgi:nicotinamide-nucleotide amidase